MIVILTAVGSKQSWHQNLKMAGTERLENVNPTIHAVVGGREAIAEDEDDDIADVIDDREVFDILYRDGGLTYIQ